MYFLCHHAHTGPEFTRCFVHKFNVLRHQRAGDGFPCFLDDKDFAVLLDAHFLQENIHDNQRDQRKKQRVIFYAVDFEDHERLVEQRAVHVLVQRFFVVAAQIEVLHHIAVCREVDARDTVLLTDIRDALHGIFIERVE